MARKKHKIDTRPAYDYLIIGISTSLKDYKLAFSLNKAMMLSLRKGDDFIHAVPETQAYSCYFYHNHDLRRDHVLIANKNENGWLISSLRTVDYFLLISDVQGSAASPSLLKKISSVPGILTAIRIEAGRIKDMDLILADLELHLLKNGLGEQ